MTEQQLRRLRVAVRVVLGLALAVSLVANVLHARDNVISQAISAWPPLALMLTVELISRVPAQSVRLAVARIMATAVIAAIAAWVSYWHMAAVAKHYGERDYGAQYLWPLTVDGLAIVASICLVEIGGRLAGRDTAADVASPMQPAPAVSTTTPAPVIVPAQDVDMATKVDILPAERIEAPLDPWERPELFAEVVEPLVANEATTWLASGDGQATAAKERVALAKRPVASYDKDAAKALIRKLIDQLPDVLTKTELDKAKAWVDASVARQFNVSMRTARRLRCEVANEPVSGPPADFQDGDR